MAQMSSRGTQLFCSLFIVIGLVAVGMGIWTLTKSLRSEQWPVTDGIIQLAEMKSHQGSKGGTTYSAEVTYTYQVAGTNYTGDKVSIGQMSSSSEYARGILNRYPVGKKVSVHYSPGDPSNAVLETGIHGGMWICLGVGTAFTLFGFMFLQINRAAARAQMPGAPESSSVKVWPDGSVTMDKPPVLMGVIFLLVGIGLCFVHAGQRQAGLADVCRGRNVCVWRRDPSVDAAGEQDIFQDRDGADGSGLVLVIFHWISFGPGERIGTVSTPFSVTHGVSVRTPFAIFTILMDVVILAGFDPLAAQKPAEATAASGQKIN